MRTFFQDKISDQASIVDLVVFGGRELCCLHGIEMSQNSRIMLLEDSIHLVKHSERLRCLQGLPGLDLVHLFYELH